MKRKLNKILIACSCAFLSLVMLFVIVGSNFLFHNFKAPTNPDAPISNGDSNNNNDNNSNNDNNDLVTPPVPDDSNLDDFELSASENFVYSLIYADLTKQYDTFIGYVPLTVQTKSNGLNPAATAETTTTETYGISYVDYEEAYVDENGKTYFSAGFISFPNEPTITESNIKSGLEIISLEEGTDEQFSYVYTYNTEDVHMHCIIDNKYVKYDIVDGTLQYQEEPFVEGMEVDDSRGNIYSYDIEDYVYIIEEIDYVPVSGVSIVGEADYQAIMDEVNRILETQEANFTYAQIEQFISHSQDALISYLLGLQEETFFGYATADLIETAKNLDPMQHLQIGVDENGNTTINLIEVTKKATMWEKIAVSITCACGVVLGVVSTAVGAPVLAGAFIGAAMEAFSQVVINETPTSDIQWAQVAVAAVSGALAGGISAGLGNIATKGVGQVIMKEVADTLCDSIIGGTEFFVNSLIGGATFQEACGNFGYGVIAGAVISGGIKIGSATLKQGAKLIKKATSNTVTDIAGKPVRKAGQEATEEAISETQEKAIQKNTQKAANNSLKNLKKYLDDNGNLYRVGKNLKPNTTFVKNGYKYVTDDLGRAYRITGDLYLATGKRLPINVSIDDVGKGFELVLDEKGHIIGARFGGSNSLENIIPQNKDLNRKAYKSLENSWAKALKEGKKVSVDIELIYSNNSFRPDEFVIKYTIDGKTIAKTLENV